MKRFISYGSTDSFENKIFRIQKNEQYIGKDDEGNDTYDESIRLSTIKCTAGEKIHGTNASVAYSHIDGFWVQSKKRILTVEVDNHGTAAHAMENQNAWLTIINQLAEEHEINLNKNIIVVYFEWAGKGIQKKSALSGFDKKAIIFQYFKVATMEQQLNINNEEEGNIWKETCQIIRPGNACYVNWVSAKDNGILNIMNYKNWEFEIDLNKPIDSLNKIIKVVETEIEPNSPVGSALGTENNVGEGLLLTFTHRGDIHRMKVKGDEHSKGNTKIERELTPEETYYMKKIQDFVIKRACTINRLEQAYVEVMSVEGESLRGDIRKTGQFMKWINQDVIKEESRQLEEAGLIMKDINKTVSNIAGKWIRERIKEDL